MEWVWKIIGGLIALLLTVIGFFLRHSFSKFDTKLDNLDEKVNLLALQKANRDDLMQHRTEDTQRFESLQMRFREDIKDVHKKIEDGQKETNRRLDTILDKLSK